MMLHMYIINTHLYHLVVRLYNSQFALNISNLMKQQSKQRRRQRQTQTFHINTDALRRYGKRTGAYFGNVNPNDRSDGYARWSDYISESSEDAYIPREASSTFSEIQKQSVGEYQSDEHSKLPDPSMEPSRVIIRKQRASNFEKRSSAVNQHNQEQKPAVQSVQNNDRKMPIPNYHLANSDKRQPFSVPEISSIKQRKSLGRDSEKYLLQLLQSQRSKMDKQRELQNKRKEEQQLNRRQQEIRINNQRKKGKNKQEKMQIQEPYKNEEKRQNIQPNTGLPQKYIPRQLKTISEKSQEAKSTKAKRVTINDKGKIKLPTDSFSADFQSILPPSLRKGEDSSYHKRQRPQQIEEDDSQLEDNPQQPMEIIFQAQQPQPKHQQYKQRDAIDTVKQEKIKKSIRITEDPEKIGTKRGKDNKKEPKISDNKKKQKKAQPVKNKSNARLPTSRPKDHNEKEASHQKGADHNYPKQNKQLEMLKKKRRTEEEDVACPISVPEHIQSNNSRPQRHRHPPSQYWKGEKPAYNKRGSLAIRCDFTPEDFMEMIGFMKPERIEAQVYSRQLKQVIARIDLKPKQYLYSGGIDYQRMRGSFNSPQQFDQLTISYQKVYQKKEADMVEVIVDDINKYTLDEPVSIQKGQTFQIKNKSDSRKYFLFISLINTSKKK